MWQVVRSVVSYARILCILWGGASNKESNPNSRGCSSTMGTIESKKRKGWIGKRTLWNWRHLTYFGGLFRCFLFTVTCRELWEVWSHVVVVTLPQTTYDLHSFSTTFLLGGDSETITSYWFLLYALHYSCSSPKEEPNRPQLPKKRLKYLEGKYPRTKGNRISQHQQEAIKCGNVLDPKIGDKFEAYHNVSATMFLPVKSNQWVNIEHAGTTPNLTGERFSINHPQPVWLTDRPCLPTSCRHTAAIFPSFSSSSSWL